MGESWGQRANDPRHCRHCLIQPPDRWAVRRRRRRRRRLFYVRRRQQVACRGFLGSRGLRTHTHHHIMTPVRVLGLRSKHRCGTLWERKIFPPSPPQPIIIALGLFFSQRRFTIHNNIIMYIQPTVLLTNRTIYNYKNKNNTARYRGRYIYIYTYIIHYVLCYINKY